MFETKKQLRKKIAELELQVKREKHHNRRSALVEKANLPPCKCVACYNCKHCVFCYNPSTSAIYILGCGKDLDCNAFSYTEENKPPEYIRLMAFQEEHPELLLKIPGEICTEASNNNPL